MSRSRGSGQGCIGRHNHRALTVNRCSAGYPFGVIPEIDIWRVANLMLNRYGDEATAESAKRAEKLAADGDLAGVATWLGSSTQSGSSRSQHHHRSGTLDRSPREQGRLASDAVRPVDLAQASGSANRKRITRCKRLLAGRVLDAFRVKLVFAAPLSFLSCA
jgi:hypothetical protein